jgi:hypothetical protein
MYFLKEGGVAELVAHPPAEPKIAVQITSPTRKLLLIYLEPEIQHFDYSCDVVPYPTHISCEVVLV